jgi:hypothetical protein
MYQVLELAAEHNRSTMEQAEQMRPWRRLQSLRRARRRECKAEQRLLEAWRRADDLRGLLGAADH